MRQNTAPRNHTMKVEINPPPKEERIVTITLTETEARELKNTLSLLSGSYGLYKELGLKLENI